MLQRLTHVALAQAAAAVTASFPPRGLIRLLPAEHTEQGKPRIERLVAEEYILDTLHFFDGDRVQCARRLAMGAPEFVIDKCVAHAGVCGVGVKVGVLLKEAGAGRRWPTKTRPCKSADRCGVWLARCMA